MTAVPRPTDAPRGHAAGRSPDRMLLLGAGPAMGWGVTTHELALPGALARAISAQTHRGCDIDLVAHRDMTAENASQAVPHVSLARYDAIIVTLGVNDALHHTDISAWRRGLTQLLAVLNEHADDDALIVLVGIQPIRSIPTFDTRRGAAAERHASMLNAETARISTAHARTWFVPLPAPSTAASAEGRHRTARQYDDWGRVLAESIVPLLAARDARPPAAASDDASARPGLVPRAGAAEAARQRAVDALDLPEPGSDERLQRIVRLAQEAFGVEAALLSVLDENRQWHLALTGTELTEIPRSSSFCEHVIQADDAMIVLDTAVDDRFRDNPLVLGAPHIRFYAGFPVETPTGQRIGALCVLDTEPRRPEDRLDVALLTELAHVAQRELWRYFPSSVLTEPR